MPLCAITAITTGLPRLHGASGQPKEDSVMLGRLGGACCGGGQAGQPVAHGGRGWEAEQALQPVASSDRARTADRLLAEGRSQSLCPSRARLATR